MKNKLVSSFYCSKCELYSTLSSVTLTESCHVLPSCLLISPPKFMNCIYFWYRSRVGDDHLSLTADCAPAVVSCGHVMHARCYQNFMDDLVKKERMTFGQG